MTLSSAALKDDLAFSSDLRLKLTVERTPFLKALSHVQSVVERRSTVAILSNVKLEARNGTLQLSATDLDMAISESVVADIQEEGALTLSAHTLYDIVRKLPDNCHITLATSDSAHGHVVISADNCQFSLGALSVDEFPVIDRGNVDNRFSLDAAELRDLIDNTRFAISLEETRYYLNGIYVHTDENSETPMLRAVATDGHRLARVETALPEGASGMPGIIIPRKAVMEIRKLTDEATGPVAIELSDAKICVHVGEATLISKLIDGTFPDYEKVIPQNNNLHMEVSVKRLAQAIDRVSTVTSEKTRAVRFVLEAGVLTISAANDDNNSGNETLDVSYSGDRIDIGFNSRYLLEMLTCFDDANAQFSFAEGNSPTLVRSPSSTSALFVLMPMKV